MKRNRYILCLLASGLMLYYALPNLTISESGGARIFSIAWLTLCLFVIAGNLAALLFPQQHLSTGKRQISKETRKKLRMFD